MVSCTDQEKYLCLIEKEAVVHALLECVSSHLDPKVPHEAKEVSNKTLIVITINISQHFFVVNQKKVAC